MNDEGITLERVRRPRRPRPTALLAGIVFGVLAIRVLVAGAELASEPITAGCFEYCDFHQAGGRWLLGLGIVGEILAVAIALGSRLATLPAIAIIVGSLAVVGIGFSQGIRGDPWTGIVVVVLALEALLLTGAFWSSFSER